DRPLDALRRRHRDRGTQPGGGHARVRDAGGARGRAGTEPGVRRHAGRADHGDRDRTGRGAAAVRPGPGAGGVVTEPVSVRTRFERFPATVKGALVFRGEDPDPHQIEVRGARVVAFSGSSERDVPVELAVVTVPPRQDVFVPFEMSVGDLEPGWY